MCKCEGEDRLERDRGGGERGRETANISAGGVMFHGGGA